MFRSRSSEEQAALDAERAAERAAKDARRDAKETARQQREFDATAIGRARIGHARGDQLLQIDLDLAAQQAWLIPTQGVGAFRNTTDPNEILNGVRGRVLRVPAARRVGGVHHCRSMARPVALIQGARPDTITLG
jgi:hypothetical protein